MMHFLFNHSIKIFLGFLFAISIFHLCIVSKIIPYHIAWGGRLQNDGEMYIFETLSILINALLSWVLLMKGNFITYRFPHRLIDIILWVFLVIFALNTLGNIFAKTTFEKFFALITGLFVVLLWNIIKNTKTLNR
jgi:hypothetical protein